MTLLYRRKVNFLSNNLSSVSLICKGQSLKLRRGRFSSTYHRLQDKMEKGWGQSSVGRASGEHAQVSVYKVWGHSSVVRVSGERAQVSGSDHSIAETLCAGCTGTVPAWSRLWDRLSLARPKNFCSNVFSC